MWEPMNIRANEGDKVIFDGVGNGWPGEWEDACKTLEVLETYIVSHVEVGGSLSHVYLKGLGDKKFNTVLFSDYKEENK
ncbi:MAG: hypothetical protein ACRC5C_05925 [Bacilli bacterium]